MNTTFAICENGNAINLDKAESLTVVRKAITPPSAIWAVVAAYPTGAKEVATFPSQTLAQAFIRTLLTDGAELCGDQETDPITPTSVISAEFVASFVADTCED